MKCRPIPFSAPMVRAILDGRKTMTRRVVKPQPEFVLCRMKDGGWCQSRPGGVIDPNMGDWRSPYGVPGDRLWVKETWYYDIDPHGPIPKAEDVVPGNLYYRADGECCEIIPECQCAEVGATRWRSSRFMPRWASRITLEVLSVRVERLQDIGKDGRKAKDVLAEGVDTAAIERNRAWFHPDDCPALAFAGLWDSINGKTHPWASNPWVWVIGFRVLQHAK